MEGRLPSAQTVVAPGLFRPYAPATSSPLSRIRTLTYEPAAATSPAAEPPEPEPRTLARAAPSLAPGMSPMPAPRAVEKPVHSAKPRTPVARVVPPVVRLSGRSASGTATWYCDPGRSICTSGYEASGFFAAAGPELRVGDWRGRLVRVCTSEACIVVQLVDWCACGGDHVIDLYHGAFEELARRSGLPASRGGLPVRVRW